MRTNELLYYQRVAATLEEKAKSNHGRLPLYQRIRLNYCKRPFLYFDTDEEITQRAYDAGNSINFLGEGGKIEVRSPDENYWLRIWMAFQQAIEEMTRRRIPYKEIIGERVRFAQYFREGDPIGLKLLRGHNFEPFEKLLKFSRRDYVLEMLKYGKFRISPASSYDTPAYNIAMADVEIERSYRFPLISEYMNGKEFFEIKGSKVPASQGYIPVHFPLPDYFLFSTCGTPERRMPTDFQSDSALLIHNPKEFISRMKTALCFAHPTWQFMDRPVKYYDPYIDLPSDQDQEFYKTFKFAYQAEHRIVLRPNGIRHYSKLEPFFVELGDLSDIAEALQA